QADLARTAGRRVHRLAGPDRRQGVRGERKRHRLRVRGRPDLQVAGEEPAWRRCPRHARGGGQPAVHPRPRPFVLHRQACGEMSDEGGARNMGMSQTVTFSQGKPPAWPAVRDLLAGRGYPVQMRMIDGELAFPDEEPPETWRELRVASSQGM